MKNRYLLIGTFLTMLILLGCKEDFLERPPKGSLVDASFYQNNDQVLAGTAALYSVVWNEYVDKALINLGDFRGGTLYRAWNDRDNVLFNTTEVSPRNGEAYRAFYNVVGQSNMAITNINKYAGQEVTEDIRNHAIAEARFMRATAYSYLVMNYGAVPIIEDNVVLLSNSDVQRNTIKSVWEFITKDYRFAADNLSENRLMPGRLTKWAAEGMLARTYLTRAGVGEDDNDFLPDGSLSFISNPKDQTFLDSAKYYAQRVIELSGASLLENYADLFIYPYDNNQESLFELQWVYTTAENGYAARNTMVSQITFSNDIANGDGWGGDLGASYWMLSLYDGLIKEDGTPGFTNDKRLKYSFMLPGFHYPEITQTVRDEEGKEDEQELVFPDPGADADQSFASPRKYIVGKIKDVEAGGGQAAAQNYPNNTYMLRLAEMYLIYAEAALGNGNSTSDAKALEYFNAVHERAGLSKIEAPLTWKDIFEERMKEFAGEGMSWYDLVRLHYYNPQEAYGIINNQDRGLFLVRPDKMPDATQWRVTKNEDAAEDRFANADTQGGNFRLPIPAAEASQAPSLRLPPVPYAFGDE